MSEIKSKEASHVIMPSIAEQLKDNEQRLNESLRKGQIEANHKALESLLEKYKKEKEAKGRD